MARKSSADTAKEKAAKQKKILIGLSVFLVLAMAYAGKTMMSLNSGGSKPEAASVTTTPAPTTATTPVTTTPAATPSLAAPSLAAPTATPTTDSSSGAPTTAGELVSAVIPKAGVGQLQSFSEFSAKDPFAKPSSSGGKSGGTKTPPVTTPPPTTTPPPGGSGTKAPAAPPTSAVISVNGTSEAVAAGATFPAANPLFQLLSLTKTTAKVTIVGGSYASGASALTLTANKAVTLVNTADGTRYTLLLFPQGTAAPAAPATTGGTTAPPAATTPTTTTPATTTGAGG
jgi:hypothetical protein